MRRDPEAARALILDAAKRVLAEVGPDRAGLKAVARAAGVSHALVTHYFGTYEALVEAALEQHAAEAQQAILERLARSEVLTVATSDAPSELIDAFFEMLERPHHGRLVAWALMTGRNTRQDFFARRVQGPRLVADAIEARLRARYPDARIDREEIERIIVMVMSVGFGQCLGRGVLWEALGRDATVEREHAFRRWLGELVRERMNRMLG